MIEHSVVLLCLFEEILNKEKGEIDSPPRYDTGCIHYVQGLQSIQGALLFLPINGMTVNTTVVQVFSLYSPPNFEVEVIHTDNWQDDFYETVHDEPLKVHDDFFHEIKVDEIRKSEEDSHCKRNEEKCFDGVFLLERMNNAPVSLKREKDKEPA